MLLAVLGESGWREDIPRLVRGALGRQQYGHWNTTVANVWGVLAMEKFSRSFESVPVSGATGVRYADQRPVVKWPQPKGEAQLTLPWAQGQSSLGIAHIGGGAPWSHGAGHGLPLEAPLFTGFKVIRTVSPAETPAAPGFVHARGCVRSRVHLDLEAQSDMSWVVVDDPIPAGATVLGSGLGGQSEEPASAASASLGMAGFRGTPLRWLSWLLSIRAQGTLVGGVHRALEQPWHLPVAGHAGGGDVCARDVRGGAQCDGHGGCGAACAMMPTSPAGEARAPRRPVATAIRLRVWARC
ncbi:MAG: hypothetical protein U1F35_17695 [Steroidobacteraceae bacterium]